MKIPPVDLELIEDTIPLVFFMLLNGLIVGYLLFKVIYK